MLSGNSVCSESSPPTILIFSSLNIIQKLQVVDPMSKAVGQERALEGSGTRGKTVFVTPVPRWSSWPEMLAVREDNGPEIQLVPRWLTFPASPLPHPLGSPLSPRPSCPQWKGPTLTSGSFPLGSFIYFPQLNLIRETPQAT